MRSVNTMWYAGSIFYINDSWERTERMMPRSTRALFIDILETEGTHVNEPVSNSVYFWNGSDISGFWKYPRLEILEKYPTREEFRNNTNHLALPQRLPRGRPDYGILDSSHSRSREETFWKIPAILSAAVLAGTLLAGSLLFLCRNPSILQSSSQSPPQYQTPRVTPDSMIYGELFEDPQIVYPDFMLHERASVETNDTVWKYYVEGLTKYANDFDITPNVSWPEYKEAFVRNNPDIKNINLLQIGQSVRKPRIANTSYSP